MRNVGIYNLYVIIKNKIGEIFREFDPGSG